MKLEQLLERLEYTCVQGSLDREISGIANDSRQVVPGTLFQHPGSCDGWTHICR